MNSYVKELSDLSKRDQRFVRRFIKDMNRSITSIREVAVKNMGCNPQMIFFKPSKKVEAERIESLKEVISECAPFWVHICSNGEIAIFL